MYLYLYRDSEEILNSYQKAKRLNYYLGWKEMIDKYRDFFPEIKDWALLIDYNQDGKADLFTSANSSIALFSRSGAIFIRRGGQFGI